MLREVNSPSVLKTPAPPSNTHTLGNLRRTSCRANYTREREGEIVILHTRRGRDILHTRRGRDSHTTHKERDTTHKERER